MVAADVRQGSEKMADVGQFILLLSISSLRTFTGLSSYLDVP
jgi:hypothetical protein